VRFEVGKTYYCRSLCDYDAIFQIRVSARTEKTVVTSEGKRLRVKMKDGVEAVSPRGRYSMSPTIYANKEVKGETDVTRP
jgi:hypothetical protein